MTPPEPKKKLPPPKARAAKRKASDISPGWDEVVPPNLEVRRDRAAVGGL